MKAYRLQSPRLTNAQFLGVTNFNGPVNFNDTVSLGSVTVKQVTSVIGSIAEGLVVAAVAGSIVAADRTNLMHADRILGISLGSGLIATAGELAVTETITAGDVLWLDENGELTTTLPTVGFQQQVAVAISSTNVILSIGLSITLA